MKAKANKKTGVQLCLKEDVVIVLKPSPESGDSLVALFQHNGRQL
jgi:hypothetical protein